MNETQIENKISELEDRLNSIDAVLIKFHDQFSNHQKEVASAIKVIFNILKDN